VKEEYTRLLRDLGFAQQAVVDHMVAASDKDRHTSQGKLARHLRRMLEAADELAEPPTGRPRFTDDQRITLLARENPKRGASRERFALYRDGMSVGEALAAGITRGDLKWDTDRDFISIA
jgi:hypothetical protein